MTILLRTIATLLLLAAPCFAQTPYPTKQVRIVVPFPAGGSADVLCRMLGDRLSAIGFPRVPCALKIKQAAPSP